MSRSPWFAIVVLGLAVAGCGAEQQQDRFDLRTPRGEEPAATAAPAETPKASPTAEPTPARKPVTRAERKVIRGWSDELRRGHVEEAASYFSVPAMVSNATTGWLFLETKKQIESFNAGLPCGAKLLRARRGTDGFVVGVFRLTERPGSSACDGTGSTAAVAFRIRDSHITRWVRADDEISEPTPTPTPASTPAGPPDSA
jgi:hypothetical protein